MHYLIVREREHKVFVVGIHQRKGNIIMMIAPVDRVQAHIIQYVMHPTHIPLHAEAQAACISGAGHHWPGRRFLGNGERAGLFSVDRFVKLTQKVDRFQVLSAAIAVGHPLPRFARIVEVEHGGDGIDAQAVDMIFAQPEQSTGDQKIAHLGTSIIKDVGAPLFMLAFAGIGIFIEVGAIKVAQGILVFGKVRGHPVEQDADALLMEKIYEVLEVFRRAIATRRRKVARDLVAPRAVIGIFGNWQ